MKFTPHIVCGVIVLLLLMGFGGIVAEDYWPDPPEIKTINAEAYQFRVELESFTAQTAIWQKKIVTELIKAEVQIELIRQMEAKLN